MTITIGTRGSRLALIQAEWVSRQLGRQGLDSRIHIIKTKGDLVQDRFDKMEGKGFFTGEIETALHRGDIDLAVHCIKDLPTAPTPGLKIAAVPLREDPMDALLSTRALTIDDTGHPDLNGLTVGTSSQRRVKGLAQRNPRARFVPIRGNVPTRIAKMEQGQADVIVLAQAGLNRLGLKMDGIHHRSAAPPILVPAPGQGALALQTREDNAFSLDFLHHRLSARCVDAERRILNQLEGGCQLPLGVLIRPRAADAFRLQLFLDFQSEHHPALELDLLGTHPETLAERAMERIFAVRP